MTSWCTFFLAMSSLFSFLLSAASDSPRFVVLSPPKCGTHLIAKVLGLITHQQPVFYLTELGTAAQGVEIVKNETALGHFVVAHNFHAQTLQHLTKQGYRVVFIIRDPRDQLISVMNWLKGGQWSWIPASKITNTDALIQELITGAKYGWRCFDGCFARYYNVAHAVSPNFLFTTRFESLVGPNGGGSTELQVNEILNLANFLRVTISNDEAFSIADEAWGGTRTFRHGEIGSWKKYFSSQHKNDYQRLYMQNLIELGYDTW